jgi:hypothetical protein
MKKYLLLFIAFFSLPLLHGQGLFFDKIYFQDEQVNTDNWYSWDMIKKNKIRAMNVYIIGSGKDTAYIIKRMYDPAGNLTAIYKEDIGNRTKTSPDAHKHKVLIEYDKNGFIKKETEDHRAEGASANPESVTWFSTAPLISEYSCITDTAGRIIQQMIKTSTGSAGSQKVFHYDRQGNIDTIRKYICNNCSRDPFLMKGDEKIEDDYVQGETTIIRYNSSGKKTMQYHLQSPDDKDTVFTRFTYNDMENSVQRETYVKRYGADDILTEVPQSIYIITYSQDGRVIKERDVRNEFCQEFIYDEKGKLKGIRTCDDHRNAYYFSYTFYK